MGSRRAVASLRGQGACVALLTHNPPYVCEWYLRRFGFDDFEGTPGQSASEGRIQAPRGIHADKPAGLRRLLTRQGVPPRRAVHVGDQLTDAALFPLIGGGVSLNSDDPTMERKADRTLHTLDLREVAQL